MRSVLEKPNVGGILDGVEVRAQRELQPLKAGEEPAKGERVSVSVLLPRDFFIPPKAFRA
jgi:hypothetical protein